MLSCRYGRTVNCKKLMGCCPVSRCLHPLPMKRALHSSTSTSPLRSIWLAVSLCPLCAQVMRTIKQNLMKLHKVNITKYCHVPFLFIYVRQFERYLFLQTQAGVRGCAYISRVPCYMFEWQRQVYRKRALEKNLTLVFCPINDLRKLYDLRCN